MPKRILAQSGNRLDFVAEEEGVAMATHILREANSRMGARLAVEAHIVANRIANGKPLVAQVSACGFLIAPGICRAPTSPPSLKPLLGSLLQSPLKNGQALLGAFAESVVAVAGILLA